MGIFRRKPQHQHRYQFENHVHVDVMWGNTQVGQRTDAILLCLDCGKVKREPLADVLLNNETVANIIRVRGWEYSERS